MSRWTDEAVEREQAREREAAAPAVRRVIPAPDDQRPGADLARTIHYAIRNAERTDRVLAQAVRADDQREALEQMVAERILRAGKERRGTARQVLAWIARAERMPHAAQREQDLAERRAWGRTYCGELASNIVRSIGSEGKDWRTCADGYTSRRERHLGTRAMLLRADASAPGYMAEALDREAVGQGIAEQAPLPSDLADLAEAVAARVGGTRAQRRDVVAALIRASECDDGSLDSREREGKRKPGRQPSSGRALLALAARRGCTLQAAVQSAKRGAAVLRERMPDGEALIRLVRECAQGSLTRQDSVPSRVPLAIILRDREGKAHRIGTVQAQCPSGPDLPTLTPLEHDAMQAIEAVAPRACYRAPKRPERPERDWQPPVRGAARDVLAWVERAMQAAERPAPWRQPSTQRRADSPAVLRRRMLDRLAGMGTDRQDSLWLAHLTRNGLTLN